MARPQTQAVTPSAPRVYVRSCFMVDVAAVCYYCLSLLFVLLLSLSLLFVLLLSLLSVIACCYCLRYYCCGGGVSATTESENLGAHKATPRRLPSLAHGVSACATQILCHVADVLCCLSICCCCYCCPVCIVVAVVAVVLPVVLFYYCRCCAVCSAAAAAAAAAILLLLFPAGSLMTTSKVSLSKKGEKNG